HEADRSLADLGQLRGLLRIDLAPLDDDSAAGRRENASEDREERRLARSRRTLERDHLARLERQRHAAQNAHLLLSLVEHLRHFACFQNGHDILAQVRKTRLGSIDATFRNDTTDATRHRRTVPKNPLTATPSG